MFRVFTDYSDATLSLNDFALFTNWFYRRSNLHFHYSPFEKSPFHIITQENSFCKCFFIKFQEKKLYFTAFFLFLHYKCQTDIRNPLRYLFRTKQLNSIYFLINLLIGTSQPFHPYQLPVQIILDLLQKLLRL